MPLLLKGTWVTIEITFLTLSLGMLIAVPVSFGQVYGPKWGRFLIGIYEKVFRSIPGIVILFLIYYGLPHAGIKMSPFWACIIGLGLRSGAYQSQIFRGAIQSIESTQMRASRSLGMTKMQGFIDVIFPQAFRVALPPWANEFTIVLKDSSFAYALGVTELLRQGGYIIATTYEPMLIYLTIAVIYFIITFTLNKSLAALETKLTIPGFDIREKIK